MLAMEQQKLEGSRDGTRANHHFADVLWTLGGEITVIKMPTQRYSAQTDS